LGDPKKADPELISNVHWMDDSNWTACSGYTLTRANYQLFNDNLLDLSHESFLHERTIGNEAVAQAPVTTKFDKGELRVHRKMPNCEPPPFYVKVTGFTSKINRWHPTIFKPPSYCLVENGSYPVDGTPEQALERRVINLITPETLTSSHYFWGVARHYSLDDAELTEFIRQQTHQTFQEDEVMLQEQQRSLGESSGTVFSMALKTDAGPIKARRLLANLIAEEQSEQT